MYLLDTNVCIQFLNERSAAIIEKLKRMDPREIYLCSIVKAELFYGARKSTNPEKWLGIHGEFCRRFKSLFFDDRAAEVYGIIRAQLAKEGRPIGPNDLIIASVALANKVTLVTHNMKEFNRVTGLVIEDWEK